MCCISIFVLGILVLDCKTVCVYLDDHCRITLKAENNQGNSDYINASPIVSKNYITQYY